MAVLGSVRRAALGIRNGEGRALLRAGWVRWDGNTLLLLTPVVILLAIFFVVPLVSVLEASFGGRGPFTLDLYEKAIFGSITRVWWEITIEQTVVTTVLCLALGYPVAYYLASSEGWRRNLVLVAVVVPFLTHFVAQTSIWRVVLGRRGWINEALTGLGIIDEPLSILFTGPAVQIGLIQTLLPFMVLCIYAGMRGIPRAFMMVANNLGAGPVRSFLRVYLPMSMPGVWAGVMLVAVLSISSFAAPDILGNVPHRGIASHLRGGGQFNSALAMVTLAGVLILYLVFVRWVGFRPLYQAGEALTGLGGEERGQPSKRRTLLGLGVGVICTYLLLPTAMIVMLSFSTSSFLIFPLRGVTLKWYRDYFTSADPLLDWPEATLNSLVIGALVTVLALVLGGIVSYFLVRSRTPGRGLFNGFVMSPLVVPTVVTAGALFHLYFHSRILSHLLGTIPGIVFPHTVLALPYVIIVLTAAMRSIDPIQERVALSLGANRLTVVRRVLLPQLYPAISIAGFLAFLVSFNEVIVALLLKARGFETLPMNIWSGRSAEYGPMMSAVSVLVLVGAGALLATVWTVRRRMSGGASAP